MRVCVDACVAPCFVSIGLMVALAGWPWARLRCAVDPSFLWELVRGVRVWGRGGRGEDGKGIRSGREDGGGRRERMERMG